MSRLNELQRELTDKGVNIPRLCVAILGGNDQVFGEIVNDEGKVNPNEWVYIKDPKRFLRLQQMTQQGIVTNFIIGDMDMVESGKARFLPTGFYFISDLGEESQLAMLSLYMNFIDRKREATAREAGLVIPDRNVSRLK